MNEGGFVILVERCTMTLSPAWFDQNSVTNVRKAFKYLFQEPWRNEDTIAALSVFLVKRIEDAKALWSKKSIEFQNEYRLPGNDTCIKRQNDRRFNEVKRAKAAYERYVKKQEIFEKFKSTKM